MTRLIQPDSIQFHARITEEELRQRLSEEVLSQIGGLDEGGKPLKGITVRVTRGDSRKGGYNISVTGPMPARLRLLPPRAE